MGRGIQWYSDAWDEYCEWQQSDRDPFNGIGKLIQMK